MDAHNVGVGAMLIQEDKVIEYHSHALTSTQQCYSNIEREAYALVNGVEHLHHYIFWKIFEVHTINVTEIREVNFEPGDNVWVCLSPIENTWKQGVIIRSVVGVPDSFIVEINGQQYRRNKHDITFSPPKGDDSAVGGATGNQHAEEQVGTENKTDRL